jgi:predicted trehalose synthase
MDAASSHTPEDICDLLHRSAWAAERHGWALRRRLGLDSADAQALAASLVAELDGATDRLSQAELEVVGSFLEQVVAVSERAVTAGGCRRG